MRIVSVKLSDIFPYYNNPRDNSGAIEPVKESFKKFGFIKPIICDKNGVIIAGHTRYIAAYQMGVEYVPVIYSEMDDEKAKLFRIADNKLSEKSEYNEDELIEELKRMKVPEEMQAFFFEDINTMINFSFDSINNIAEGYGGFEEYSTEDDYSHEDSDDSEYFEGEEGESVDDTEKEDEEVDPAVNLFVPMYREDGSCYMKVVCPFCGNIEQVDIE